MIEITGLTKNFEGVKAINNLTISLNQGIIGLVGQNGSGKSTLFRLISGVIRPDGGLILVNGHNGGTLEAKKDVFFLSDDPYAPNKSNIKECLNFYECFYSIDESHFYNILNKFGLTTTNRIDTFSKGMRRQLFLALALSINCPILLLDEAFDGLDPLVLATIKEEIINSYSENKCVVVSSHNISSLERLVDTFVVLYKGEVSKEGESALLGRDFKKYQIVSEKPLLEKDLVALGLMVVSFKKVGSIYNVVFNHEDGIEDKVKQAYHPSIFEEVPIDPDEIIALEMMMAKKGDKNHD